MQYEVPDYLIKKIKEAGHREIDRQCALFYLKAFLITTVMLLAIFVVVARAETVNTTKAIIHHSAGSDVSASTIDKWHKAKGWKCIGYHFVIRANGDIEKGRPLTMKGAHAKGRNQYVGICLTGRDYFTPAQIKSLAKLLKQLRVKEIEPHHERCPGKGLNLARIR